MKNPQKEISKYLGPFSKEWDVFSLGQLFDFKNGINAGKEDYGTGTKFVNVLEVITHDSLTSDDIPGSVHVSTKQLNEFLVQYGDVLFNRTSETPEEVGLSSVYLSEDPVVFGGFVIRAKPKTDVINDEYKKYCFSASYIRKQIISSGKGAVRSNIGQGELEKVIIAIPPKQDQKKIVSILALFDKAIRTQSLLIQDKEKYRNAISLKLLNAEIRFKGFKDPWTTLPLGKLAVIKTGGRDNQNKVENGKYPFFVRSEKIERINSFSFDGEAILVPGEGRIGEIFHYINGKFDYHQRVYRISNFSKDIFGKYCYHYFKEHFRKEVAKHSVKATVDSLRLPTFLDMLIRFPSISEQKRIARLLDSLDEEMKSHKLQLLALKTQRNGLMEKLVAGKVKLKK